MPVRGREASGAGLCTGVHAGNTHTHTQTQDFMFDFFFFFSSCLHPEQFCVGGPAVQRPLLAEPRQSHQEQFRSGQRSPGAQQTVDSAHGGPRSVSMASLRLRSCSICTGKCVCVCESRPGSEGRHLGSSVHSPPFPVSWRIRGP